MPRASDVDPESPTAASRLVRGPALGCSQLPGRDPTAKRVLGLPSSPGYSGPSAIKLTSLATRHLAALPAV